MNPKKTKKIVLISRFSFPTKEETEIIGFDIFFGLFLSWIHSDRWELFPAGSYNVLCDSLTLRRIALTQGGWVGEICSMTLIVYV